MELAQAQAEEDEKPKKATRSRRGRGRGKAAEAKTDDAVVTAEVAEVSDTVEPAAEAQADADEMAKAQTAEVIAGIPGMDVVDLEGDPAPQDDATAEDAIGDDEAEDGFNAAEHAAERDENVESVGDDGTEEVRAPRRHGPGNTRFRKSSRFAKFCWFRSSRKSAATRARR